MRTRLTLVALAALLCLAALPFVGSALDTAPAAASAVVTGAPVASPLCPATTSLAVEPPPTCDPVACSIECGGFGFCRGNKCRCGI